MICGQVLFTQALPFQIRVNLEIKSLKVPIKYPDIQNRYLIIR